MIYSLFSNLRVKYRKYIDNFASQVHKCKLHLISLHAVSMLSRENDIKILLIQKIATYMHTYEYGIDVSSCR